MGAFVHIPAGLRPNVIWALVFGAILLCCAGSLAGMAASDMVAKTAFLGTIGFAAGVLGIAMSAAKQGVPGRFNPTLWCLMAVPVAVLVYNGWVLHGWFPQFMDSALEAAFVGLVSTFVGIVAGYMRDDVV